MRFKLFRVGKSDTPAALKWLISDGNNLGRNTIFIGKKLKKQNDNRKSEQKIISMSKKNGNGTSGFVTRVDAAIRHAAVMFVFAAHKNEMVYNARNNAEPQKKPEEYPELAELGLSERELTTEDGRKIVIWERKADPGKPHAILFHGRSGHWGDVGPKTSMDLPNYNRRGRLMILQEWAALGVGFTAVTLGGFGRSEAMRPSKYSEGVPCEEGFEQDIHAVCSHVLQNPDIDKSSLIISGESLGTWPATRTAVEMTRRGFPPAKLCLTNPFHDFATVAAERVNAHPDAVKRHVHYSARLLDNNVLKHEHFYTYKLFNELKRPTHVHITISAQDQIVNPENSKKLLKILQERRERNEDMGAPGFSYKIFDKADHYGIPYKEAYDLALSCEPLECLSIADWSTKKPVSQAASFPLRGG